MGEKKSRSSKKSSESKAVTKEDADSSQTKTETNKSSLLKMLGTAGGGSRKRMIFGFGVLMVLAAGGYWFWRKRKAGDRKTSSTRRGRRESAPSSRQVNHLDEEMDDFGGGGDDGAGLLPEQEQRMDLAVEIDQANERLRRITGAIAGLQARGEAQSKAYHDSFATDTNDEPQSIDSAFLLKEDQDKRREASGLARQETAQLMARARHEAALEHERLRGLHERYLSEYGVPYVSPQERGWSSILN